MGCGDRLVAHGFIVNPIDEGGDTRVDARVPRGAFEPEGNYPHDYVLVIDVRGTHHRAARVVLKKEKKTGSN